MSRFNDLNEAPAAFDSYWVEPNQVPGGSCTRWSPAPFTAHCFANHAWSLKPLMLAVALLGFLSIPVQISRMNFSKHWAKLVFEIVVLLFSVIAGIVIVSERDAT